MMETTQYRGERGTHVEKSMPTSMTDWSRESSVLGSEGGAMVDVLLHRQTIH